jgi:glycosyltransferase involved in cell wall biosynthesis
MKVLIAIPVHNEERYLARILDRVRRYAQGCDILAVDDGSTDRSGEILRQYPGIVVVAHEHNQGYDRTMADAFAYADQQAYDWVITLDADEQHDPARIPDFIEMARRDDADILSGSRYMKEESSYEQVPGDRRQVNYLMTVLLNNVLKLCLTDSFCGFKAHRVAALRKLRLTVSGYAFPMQFWVQAVRAGLRITEIPIKLIYHDPTRRFGGGLDDATIRLRHYVEVLVSELTDPAGPVLVPEGSAFFCPCSRC